MVQGSNRFDPSCETEACRWQLFIRKDSRVGKPTTRNDWNEQVAAEETTDLPAIWGAFMEI